jgi:hypothetical protein
MLQAFSHRVNADESGYNSIGIHRRFFCNGCSLATNILTRELLNIN